MTDVAWARLVPDGWELALRVQPGARTTEVVGEHGDALKLRVAAPANDGKANGKGLPNPFRLAVIANHHFDDVRLPFPPAWLQKLGLVAGAPVGRVLGYRPAYVPAGAGDVSLAI